MGILIASVLALGMFARESQAFFSFSQQPLDAFSVGRDQDDGVIAALSLDREDKSEETLRKLGANGRLDARKHLLSLSKDPDILADPVRRLALVEALHRHDQGPLRLEVTRALIRLFKEQSSEPSRFRSSDETDDLATRVRGTTAMALALGEHPLGLRVLLATAAQGEDLDPLGATLARAAMAVVPVAKWRSPALSHLFDRALVERLLRGQDAPSAVQDPSALVALVRSPPSAREAELFDIAAWGNALYVLSTEKHLAGAFASTSAWTKAHADAPTATLRSLACLAERLPRSVHRHAERLAARSLESSDESERSAAAWVLAIVAPKRAVRLLDSRDPVIVAAVLRQAHTGELARAASDLQSLGKKKASLSGELRTVAARMIGWEPSLWGQYSNTSLWSDESTDLGFRFALLASRFDPDGSGQGPNARVIRAWLKDADPAVRSSAAYGLGRSQKPSGAGLLLNAYRREADVEVRRALVSALSGHPKVVRGRLAEWVQLDPDPECRRPATRQSTTETTFRVKVQPGKMTSLTDSKGRVLWAIPAPDGFVGVVSTFD